LEGQVPVFISPRKRVTQLHPQAQSFLSVAFYDSQGYGEGIRTHVHTPGIEPHLKHQTLRKMPHIYTRHPDKLHTLSSNNIKLCICLKYPNYVNNPIILSTHRKQQQTEQQPKQQTSQKQRKALSAMTMTIGSPGKKSAEEGRKEEAPESQKCQQ
jgi:hypothetical protein